MLAKRRVRLRYSLGLPIAALFYPTDVRNVIAGKSPKSRFVAWYSGRKRATDR
jgi:hypothetical protein